MSIERLELNVRTAGEKAILADEFVTKSQIVGGTINDDGDIVLGSPGVMDIFAIEGDGIADSFNITHNFLTDYGADHIAHEAYYAASGETVIVGFTRTDGDNALIDTDVLGDGEIIYVLIWANVVGTGSGYSPPAGADVLYKVKRTLTPTELRSTADIELIPAPGANKIVFVNRVLTSYRFIDQAYTGGEFTDLYFGTTAGGVHAYFDLGLTGVKGGVDFTSILYHGNSMPNGATSNYADKAIVIGGHTLANASANGTLTLILDYTIADIS